MSMMRRTMWMFLLASAVLTGGPGEASQLLYVTSADSLVYTYDVSLGSAAAIKASESALIGNFHNSDPVSVAMHLADTIYVGNSNNDTQAGTGNSTVSIYNSVGAYRTEWTSPGSDPAAQHAAENHVDVVDARDERASPTRSDLVSFAPHDPSLAR